MMFRWVEKSSNAAAVPEFIQFFRNLSASRWIAVNINLMPPFQETFKLREHERLGRLRKAGCHESYTHQMD
jgi:hypothetical protein